MGGQLDQCLVAQDAAARQVALLRLGLAPGGNSLQRRQRAGLRVAQLEPGAESKMFAVTIEAAAGSSTPTPPIVYSGTPGD